VQAEIVHEKKIDEPVGKVTYVVDAFHVERFDEIRERVEDLLDIAKNLLEIVEQIDCTAEQREIKEVFPSYYCVRAEELIWAVGQLKNDNKKSEFYLTDIYEHIRKSGKRVLAVQAVTMEDVLAPNTLHELALADTVMQERIQREHRDRGVSIPSPMTTYIEDGASIGADTTVFPVSFIGRDASIGAECTIGPFAIVPRNSVVREGTTVAGNVTPETALLQVEP